MFFKSNKLCKILPTEPKEHCVICLSPSLKYSGCKRCNTCIICKKCFNQLIKTGNKKCPTCNLECDKCINKENHEVCDWSTRKNIVYDIIIDIPHIRDDSIILNPIDNVSNEIDCKERSYQIYEKIKPMLKLINYICTLFLLSFLVGLIVISFVELGKKNDMTLEFTFICVSTGFLIILGVVCLTSMPCCCNYNLCKFVWSMYFGNDRN